MNAPRSFGYFATVFAAVFAVAYVVAMAQNYALFTYHPVPNTITMGVVKSFDGPAMYWFGWIATGTLAALAACLVAALVPHGARRLSPVWSWAAPLGMLFVLAYLLRNYFLS